MNIIYTDGASSGNPGPGGWAAVIDFGDRVLEIGDGEPKTTNNRMELTAALEALRAVPADQDVRIYTDSKYLVNGITEWIFNWQKNDWQTKDKKEVSNKDLWQDLAEQVEKRKQAGGSIDWKVIRGHAGISGNNRADQLAVTFSSAVKPELYNGPKDDYKIDISEPSEANLNTESTRDRSKSKAYSYLSMVDRVWKRHDSWAECQARVKGKSDARFRKTVSADDEREILKSWGLNSF